jgi:predicted outer membrane repeat protein
MRFFDKECATCWPGFDDCLRAPPSVQKTSRPRVRLRLEWLEDRLTPAALMVTSDLDNGPGSLRAVIGNAAANSVINFAPNLTGPTGQTIDLNSEIAITQNNLTIDGTTAQVTISGQQSCRIFDITGKGLSETINNLNLFNGSAPGNNEPHLGDGGAIYDQGSLTLTGDTFTENSAAIAGGAVYNVPTPGTNGTVTVNGPNASFRNNAAGAAGGAIEVAANTAGNNVVLNGVAFTSDYAGKNGGAGNYGGAVDANGLVATTMQVTACGFSNNAVLNTGDGGGIHTSDQLTVSCPYPGPQTTFTSNIATNGGAIAYEPIVDNASNMTLSNVTFTTNTASVGGAVYISATTNTGTVSIAITGSLFNGNQANITSEQSTEAGGGLYYFATTAGTGNASLNITNSTFFRNGSEENGGGLYVTLANIGTGSNAVVFTSLTVFQNQAANSGGGLYVSLLGSNVPPTFHVGNSILAGNSIENPPSSGPDVFVGGSTKDFTSDGYNLVGVHDPQDGATWGPLDYVGSQADPKLPALDPTGLQSNGGPTQTLKLLTTAGGGYHMGNPNLAGKTDQRGYIRQNNPPTIQVSVGAYDPDATPPS